MVRVYSDVSGLIDGSIIAAIIRVQAPRKARTPRPIVPGMTSMSVASAIVANHAPAATVSRIDVSATESRRSGADRSILSSDVAISFPAPLRRGIIRPASNPIVLLFRIPAREVPNVARARAVGGPGGL